MVQSTNGKNRWLKSHGRIKVLVTVCKTLYRGKYSVRPLPCIYIVRLQTCDGLKRTVQKQYEWLLAPQRAYHCSIRSLRCIDCRYHHRLSAGKLHAQSKARGEH